MATSRVQFFSTPEEVPFLLCPIVKKLKLQILAHRKKAAPTIEKIDCADLAADVYALDCMRLYLAPETLSHLEVDPQKIEAAKLGLLVFVLPRIVDRNLFMSELAVRTDWVEDDQRVDNRRLMTLFKKSQTGIVKKPQEALARREHGHRRQQRLFHRVVYARGARIRGERRKTFAGRGEPREISSNRNWSLTTDD